MSVSGVNELFLFFLELTELFCMMTFLNFAVLDLFNKSQLCAEKKVIIKLKKYPRIYYFFCTFLGTSWKRKHFSFAFKNKITFTWQCLQNYLRTFTQKWPNAVSCMPACIWHSHLVSKQSLNWECMIRSCLCIICLVCLDLVVMCPHFADETKHLRNNTTTYSAIVVYFCLCFPLIISPLNTYSVHTWHHHFQRHSLSGVYTDTTMAAFSNTSIIKPIFKCMIFESQELLCQVNEQGNV